MPYPSTITSVLEGKIEQILAAATELEESLADIPEADRREFHRIAAVGARAFVDTLRKVIDADCAKPLHMTMAELVLTAAWGGGWVSSRTVDAIEPDREAMDDLRAASLFDYFPAVPGRWVACYRLIDPAGER